MSDQERWQTPPEVWNPLVEEFRFDLDAFADDLTKRLPHYSADSLGTQEWPGERIWMNPPYGRKLEPCVRRGAAEAVKRGKLVVALIPLRGRGPWWHEAVINVAPEVRFVRKRVSFIRPDGSRGEFTGSCDSVLIVWKGKASGDTRMQSFFQRFEDTEYVIPHDEERRATPHRSMENQ